MQQSQDVVDIVQLKFLPAEIVKCVHLNVTPITKWNNDYRILALVESNNCAALFVLVSNTARPSSISHLIIETAIPIDEHFSCDTEPILHNQSEIIFVITQRSSRLRFKIEIGSESSNFASEIIKSKEYSNLHELDFSWLDKYTLPMDEQNIDQAVFARHNVAYAQTTSSNRDSILRYQLKLKEPEYTQLKEFTIFVGTWNVNGQPPSVSLQSWLSCDEDPPDIYAIGLQEIDLSKEAFLFNDTPRESEWQKFVMEGIHPNVSYRMIALVRLVGMQLVVFINSRYYSYVRNVAIDSVGTGLLGKMGNKGGVVVRFELHNTSLCFVNSHLAAYIEQFERRNQDYKDINARINFRRFPHTITTHEQVYWLGDLNYRITELSTDHVKTLLDRNEMSTLLKADQLNQQKDRGNVFLDYVEADLTFPPTYKYDLNTDIFDTSEKARPPAWTDRILYRGYGVTVATYRSHMDLKMSDHKPVSALFKSEISVIDPTKYRRIHEDLLKKMDKLENEFLPQVTIDRNEVVFDLIKFREPQYKEIIIANTGQVPAEFEFIKKLNEVNYCKEWLRIMPYDGTIDPGEKCDVRFEVNLEADLDEIYDILVLHLKGGKDMFITITGKCQRSCFTTNISVLCRAPIPILNMDDVQWNILLKRDVPILYAIPREIWLLVDHLYRHGLKTKDLFETCGLQEEFVTISNWLDFGSTTSLPGSIYAIAEALLVFLSFTKEPIVPYALQDTCVAASHNFHNCRNIILQKLEELNRNVFLYICLFLQELLRYSNDNGYDAKTLSSLFGEILLRDPVRNTKPQTNRGKSNFVYNFLVNDLSVLIFGTK